MTHELKNIISAYLALQSKKISSVLASVVALEGSSYRRPGVRMLIGENGQLVGAVSGGCVEKEVIRQAASVFKDGVPKVMTYDGRYRLGCEGILYILIEPFSPSIEMVNSFEETIRLRENIEIYSYYQKQVIQDIGLGSEIKILGSTYPVSEAAQCNYSLEKFSQHLKPCYRLIIVGSEHDAVALCSFASGMGWEVSVVAHPTEEKELKDFPGAMSLKGVTAEEIEVSQIDKQTAVILMTHSYVKDLQFLIALQHSTPVYLGLLGPNKRREKLLNEFLEHCPEVADTFFDHVYGPAGLNIGGETPQEIAISVLAEILAVIRGKQPILLRDKKGGIHA